MNTPADTRLSFRITDVTEPIKHHEQVIVTIFAPDATQEQEKQIAKRLAHRVSAAAKCASSVHSNIYSSITFTCHNEGDRILLLSILHVLQSFDCTFK